MINNFEDFIIESELVAWEKMNEQSNWEDNINRIFDYIDDAFSKGERVFIYVLKKIFKYFETNPKVLLIVVGLLVAKYKFTKENLIDVVPEDSSISAEDLYDQSIESEDGKIINYNTPISGGLKKFLTSLAYRESSLDPEKVNSIGYMGKYQFGKIAMKDILKKKRGESEHDYHSRISRFWPKNFGLIRTDDDFNFFKSRFKNKGVEFWPEHKQDLAMKQLLKNNKAYLGDYIKRWVGKEKKGIKITESGLLAGAHLLGPSRVKEFLDNGTVTTDDYGTPITEYIEKFGGYNINL